MRQKADLTVHTVLARLGLTYNFTNTLPYLPVFLLFIGPLYTTFLAQSLPLQIRWGFRTHVISVFGTWQGLRNYIIAPITEELVFRGCVLAVYQLAGAKKRSMIFLSPFSFGVGP
jgi:prenyl protein peptidase